MAEGVYAVCRYCNQRIWRARANWGTWAHEIREPGNYIIRCQPELTGEPYGLEATPL